jgi:biopolymer transport protein ExbD
MDTLLPARRKPNSDDNLIPLINIVFLLLIFFMVAGQVREQTAAGLVLPERERTVQPAATPLKVEITRLGELFVNGRATALPALAAALVPYQQERPPVAVLADRELVAATLGPVLLTLQQEGFSSVRLYTRATPEGQD